MFPFKLPGNLLHINGTLILSDVGSHMFHSVVYHSSQAFNLWVLYCKSTFIRKEKKPAGGGTRCLQCPIEIKCPYSAKKIYLDPAPTKPRWPMSPVCDIEDGPGGYLFNLTKAIETGLIKVYLCIKEKTKSRLVVVYESWWSYFENVWTIKQAYGYYHEMYPCSVGLYMLLIYDIKEFNS